MKPPQLEYSIGKSGAIKLTITSIGTCSPSGTGGGGNPNGVPGQTLGDPSLLQWCPVCGIVPDPIHLGTGNMFERENDYHTFGANPLAFTRYYNSMTAAPTLAKSLGSNWRSNYDRYLDISASSVIAERPDGRQVTFTPSGNAWTTSTDIDMTLVNSGSTWTLTDHHDTVETYTALSASQGLLMKIQARNGYTQTLQYNSSNQVTSVTDSFNRQLGFAYNNGLLQSLTTPDGLVVTYGFTSSGGANVLASVTYSTMPVATKRYVYENTSLPASLTGIIDENGARFMTWTYDSTGRALTSQAGGGADLTTIVYHDTDGSRTVTNPLGEQVLYKFSTLQGVPKVLEADRLAAAGISAASSIYTYDSNGYMASATDWNGNKMTFVNDSRGEPTTIVEAAGTSLARTTTFAYHPTFRLPLKVVTPGETINFAYDPSGELLTTTLTDTTTTTTPYSTNGQTRTWTLTWSNFLTASIQGPRTDVAQLTKFGYDSSGALTSITNALNQTVQISQHLPGGLPQTVIDGNGVTRTFSYDARQRPVSLALQTPAGTLTTSLAYDTAGNLVSMTWPDGSSFTNKFDIAHRLTGFSDKLGNSIAFTLDNLGDRTQITAADASGSVQFKRSGVFDALGRLLKAAGAANQTETLVYDPEGNILSMTDALNHATQQSFDALNRKTKVTTPANGVDTIVFDAHNRPVSVTDPNGATTAYTYDGFGDLIQQVSPVSGTTIFHLDAAGNVVQKIDGRGVVMNLAYDALNRRTGATFPANPAENITYTYDESGHGSGIGRLTSMNDASGTLSRSYDERGNPLRETRTRGNATLVTSYTYDAGSRLASITYPSRWSIAYTRDAAGRITSIGAQSPAGKSQSIVSSVSYAPFGPVNGFTYGNGISGTRSLDLDYRVRAMNDGNIQNLSYTYDAANNVLGIADGVNASNNQNFGYDSFNRLTSATGRYGKLSYTYDANGNRTSETSAATSDGLNSVTGFTYDQAGRLSGVLSGSQALTQYSYDGAGRRLVKIGATTGTTLYQYDPGGRLLEEADAQGNAQVDYVYLGGRPVAGVQADGSIYFLHNDRLGTPQLATDGSQSVIWSTSYEPFGKIATAPTQVAQNLRLPGQESDLESGLYHNGFRDYVPGLGAYQKSDPIGLMGGMNTYAYAGANPLRFTDPFGLDCPLGQQGVPVSIDQSVLRDEMRVADDQFNLADLTFQQLGANIEEDFWQGFTGAFEVATVPLTVGIGYGEAGVQALADTSAGEDILTLADLGWEYLAKAVGEGVKLSSQEELALGSPGGILSAIGVGIDVAEAPTGQKYNTFIVSGTGAVLSLAAATAIVASGGTVLVALGTGAVIKWGVNQLGQGVNFSLW